MSRVRSSDTRLELLLRSALHRAGLRYRVRTSMLGRPDLVFPLARVIVFIDSCFWHACPSHCRRPKSNRAFWREKFIRNARRDRKVTAHYSKTDWTVLRFWEHDLTTRLRACVRQVRAAVRR
jgi:DNA mismatch endonuclease (patch repair protein)